MRIEHFPATSHSTEATLSPMESHSSTRKLTQKALYIIPRNGQHSRTKLKCGCRDNQVFTVWGLGHFDFLLPLFRHSGECMYMYIIHHRNSDSGIFPSLQILLLFSGEGETISVYSYMEGRSSALTATGKFNVEDITHLPCSGMEVLCIEKGRDFEFPRDWLAARRQSCCRCMYGLVVASIDTVDLVARVSFHFPYAIISPAYIALLYPKPPI